MAQWVKVSTGWVDLDKIVVVTTMPDAVALQDRIGSGNTTRYFHGADAEAISDYLDRVAVNKPQAGRNLRSDAGVGD